MAKPHRNVLWVNRNLSWSTFFVLGPIFDIGAGYILSGVLDQVVFSCTLMFLGCHKESRETLARLRRLDNCCTWATIKTNKKHWPGSEDWTIGALGQPKKTNKRTNKKTNTRQAQEIGQFLILKARRPLVLHA